MIFQVNKFKAKAMLLALALTALSYPAFAEWDGKSPIWMGVPCATQITFSLWDKMGVYPKYDIQYFVGIQGEKGFLYSATRSYTNNSADSKAVFPDDFHSIRVPSEKADALCNYQIKWAAFVNGKEIESGIGSGALKQLTFEGKSLNTHNKGK